MYLAAAPGCAKVDNAVGTYVAVTELEWTVALELTANGKCIAKTTIYLEDGGNEEDNVPCSWQIIGREVRIAYPSGAVETFHYSDMLSFSSIGRQGSAPGLQPIGEAASYPVTLGYQLWREDDVLALFD